MLRVVLRNVCKLTFAPNGLLETSDSGAAVTPAVGSGPLAKQSASSWVAFSPPETGVWWRARLKATQIWFSILHRVIHYSWLVVHKENSSEPLWGGRDFCGVITGKAQVETPLCLVIYTAFCFETAGQAKLDLLNAAACLWLIFFPLRVDVTFSFFS